jgi:hypothetical protein
MRQVTPPAADDAGEDTRAGEIAAIMEKYRARIDVINAQTPVEIPVVDVTDSNKESSDIINESRVKLQQMNTVVDDISSEVRKLEVYNKVLTMVRRSLSSSDKRYWYRVSKERGLE